MGRPRATSDEAVFLAIDDVLAVDGPGELSLSKIGARAGITAGALVQRFGSKRAMLLAYVGQAAPGSHLMDADIPSGPAAVRQLFARMVPLIASPEELSNRLAFGHQISADPEFRAVLSEHVTAVYEQIKPLLDEAVWTGELRACNTGRLAALLDVTYRGALATWTTHQQRNLQSWVEAMLDSVLEPYLALQEPGAEEPDGLIDELTQSARSRSHLPGDQPLHASHTSA